jgi:hypothetical protein
MMIDTIPSWIVEFRGTRDSSFHSQASRDAIASSGTGLDVDVALARCCSHLGLGIGVVGNSR